MNNFRLPKDFDAFDLQAYHHYEDTGTIPAWCDPTQYGLTDADVEDTETAPPCYEVVGESQDLPF